MKADRFLWALVGATSTTYLLLVFLIGPELQRLAGGEMTFDLRMTGYDIQAARDYFLAAERTRDDTGVPLAKSYYINVLKPMDTVFPLLFGMSMALSLSTRAPVRLGRILALVALTHTLLDLMENNAIAAMFEAGSGVTEATVRKASTLTVLKFLTVLPALPLAIWFLFRPVRCG